MATAKKVTAPKATRKAKVELTPIDVLKPGPTKRPGGGKKGQLYGMVPRKGITYRALLTAAEKEKLPVDRIKGWLPRWVRKGYLAVD